MKTICKWLILCFLLSLIPSVSSAQSYEWRVMHQGNTAFRARQYDKAQSLYMKALKHDPSNTRAMFNLADTYLAKGDAQTADSLYEKVAHNDRNTQIRAMACHNRGYIRQKKALTNTQDQQQLLRQAIEMYKQALRLNPHDNDTRYNLVLCQRQLKDDQNKQQNQKKQQKQQQPQSQQQQKQQQQDKQQSKQQQQNSNQQQKQQTEQYINLMKQAEKQTRQRVNAAQPRQRSLDKNW